MSKVLRFVGFGAAAALMTTVQASSMNCNPSQDTGVGAPLNSCNPAYGSEIDKSCTPSIDVSDSDQCKQTTGSATAGSTTNTHSLRRMEDASNADVADLETYFGESLELDFTTLKEQYSSASAAITPWPGSYWPTYQDGINVIWKSGDKSASEKYAEAYGLDPIDFTKKISAKTGIDSRSSSTPCSADADCASRQDGSVCAMHKNATSGYCIPTWYGLCHAWAPAALLEAEPKCDVVKNNQTFHVMDIKALLTDVYDGSSISTVFTGARFNGPDVPADTDSYGRYTSASRRDLGPGFFHIAISNILGKHNQSFIVDVASDAQVWNQPVRSYHVQTMELVDVNQSSQQYFGVSPYPFNSEMAYLAYVKTTLSWIVEAYADGPLVTTGKVDTYTVSDDYEYLLELDANYAVIGGEWVAGSKTDHPDFLWFPTAKPDVSTITSTGLSYANVKELLELSLSCGATEQASSSTSNSASSMSASLSTSNSGSASMSTSLSSSATASGSASTSSSATALGTSASSSASASALMSTSSSGDSSASMSGSTSTVAVESMSVSTSAAASASTSAYPSATSSASMSASASVAASASGSPSISSSIASGSSGNDSIENEASAENSGIGTNEGASTEVVVSSATSGDSSYEARGDHGDQSSVVTPIGESEGNEDAHFSPSSGSTGTTDATETYSSGSTEGETPGSLPSGKDALILTTNTLTPGTTSNIESTAATHTPIGIGNYTPPPTVNGQDLADVIGIMDTSPSATDVSSSTATATITSASAHLSC